MKAWIRQVSEGRDLQAGEAADAMTCIMDGQATDAQIAELLMAMRMEGETVEEITAFARVMRAGAVTVFNANKTRSMPPTRRRFS